MPASAAAYANRVSKALILDGLCLHVLSSFQRTDGAPLDGAPVDRRTFQTYDRRTYPVNRIRLCMSRRRDLAGPLDGVTGQTAGPLPRIGQSTSLGPGRQPRARPRHGPRLPRPISLRQGPPAVGDPSVRIGALGCPHGEAARNVRATAGVTARAQRGRPGAPLRARTGPVTRQSAL
jgi:hypothetical protein